jgi:hypothetical protein
MVLGDFGNRCINFNIISTLNEILANRNIRKHINYIATILIIGLIFLQYQTSIQTYYTDKWEVSKENKIGLENKKDIL